MRNIIKSVAAIGIFFFTVANVGERYREGYRIQLVAVIGIITLWFLWLILSNVFFEKNKEEIVNVAVWIAIFTGVGIAGFFLPFFIPKAILDSGWFDFVGMIFILVGAAILLQRDQPKEE